jgi:hypothetical protein
MMRIVLKWVRRSFALHTVAKGTLMIYAGTYEHDFQFHRRTLTAWTTPRDMCVAYMHSWHKGHHEDGSYVFGSQVYVYEALEEARKRGEINTQLDAEFCRYVTQRLRYALRAEDDDLVSLVEKAFPGRSFDGICMRNNSMIFLDPNCTDLMDTVIRARKAWKDAVFQDK